MAKTGCMCRCSSPDTTVSEAVSEASGARGATNRSEGMRVPHFSQLAVF